MGVNGNATLIFGSVGVKHPKAERADSIRSNALNVGVILRLEYIHNVYILSPVDYIQYHRFLWRHRNLFLYMFESILSLERTE